MGRVQTSEVLADGQARRDDQRDRLSGVAGRAVKTSEVLGLRLLWVQEDDQVRVVFGLVFQPNQGQRIDGLADGHFAVDDEDARHMLTGGHMIARWTGMEARLLVTSENRCCSHHFKISGSSVPRGGTPGWPIDQTTTSGHVCNSDAP